MSLLTKIHVTLKPGMNDPQGQAILGGLHTLGFSGMDMAVLIAAGGV